MAKRVAVIAMVVDDFNQVETLNDMLHEHSEYILGRMGIPYREKGVSVITVALDAPQDYTSSLAGKIGALPGVSVKTAFSAFCEDE